ncbi:hypothetical protein C2G38_2197094 [Gigaspora rosea]|uniref:Uncharacterized protein n=1 Tax=Gigaspora rosea TaxID=44941 RepID=A0A397V1D7_9GLOM|nr:hypothetical protein C2G38_2197094 [Gigaspora rosea]
MYICITANGPIENLYKNLREHNSLINIEAFIRRVRFTIKFEEDPIDSRIGKRNITRIFEKENKQDFNNRIFDIEFNRETILEQAKKVTKEGGGRPLIKNNQVINDTALISNLKNKLLNLEETNYESELNFDDSNFSQSKKKGKYRQDNIIVQEHIKEQLNNNIEQEQLEIQQFIEQKQLEIQQFIKQKQIKNQQFY